MKPRARTDALVIQEAGDELLIFDLTTNKAYCLNEASARIWRACDGTNDFHEMSRRFGGDDLVWLALNDLKKQKLVEHELPTPEKFEGMTRRQVVKRIGLSTMLAIPMVAGLVAPAAAQTGTCIVNAPGCNPNGAGACNSGSPTECCSCMCNVVSPDMGNCVA
jgi:hypothetical protein